MKDALNQGVTKSENEREKLMNTNILERTEPVIAGTSDLEQARVYLEQTRCYAIGATRGLTDTQWKFKPAADRWSILEIVEHMVAIQELVLGPIWEQLAKAPPSTGNRDYKPVDGIVMYQFPNRLNTFPSPLQPSGRLEPAVAFDRLLKNHGRIVEYLESTPDLRQRMRESPPLKAITKGALEFMDGYQWLLTAAAHTQRHTNQILEVKSDPNFPAS
ncbi:MAG: DinB superfamily protein [Bryobacterales bacterium]|nr:DinB superfamily protein [Bryobacterales bacterium]